jgi:putative ABC transport system permease protein
VGDRIELHSGQRAESLTVAGIVSTGAAEDNQVVANLQMAQELSDLPSRVSLVQMSIAGSPEEIQAAVARLSGALPNVEVRPIRQIAAAQGPILQKIQGMLFWTVALILILSGLGVLASMAALAMERRRDVGLMKALGAPVPRIMRLFLTEAGVLGLAGGSIGFLIGIFLARWIGTRVFGVAVSPRLEIFPATVLLTLGVALAGALPLRLLGRVRPAEILRGE